MNEWSVTDVGDSWRFWNRPDITDYREIDIKMHGGKSRAGLGTDPINGDVVVVYADYSKDIWKKDDLTSAPEEIKATLESCPVCDAFKRVSQNPLPGVQVFSPPVPMSSPPLAQAQVQASLGALVSPSYIPFAANLAKKVFCTKLGDCAVGLGLSVFADMMAGWSSDPGQKAAFSKMSSQFITDIGIQTDSDVELLKQDVGQMYDAWKRTGDMFGAVKSTMFRGVDEAAKASGIPIQSYNAPMPYRERKRIQSLVD